MAMDDELRRGCRDLLHIDASKMIHRVYRELSWLEHPSWWPATIVGWTEYERRTVCGLIIDNPDTHVEDACITCMACSVVTEVDVLRIDVDVAKHDYHGACRLVADMHEAVMGRSGVGP